MATRSLLTTLTKQRPLFGAAIMGRSVHTVGNLFVSKSSKELRPTATPTNSWTEKQHEEWVDRMFGPLKKKHNDQQKTSDTTKETANKSQ